MKKRLLAIVLALCTMFALPANASAYAFTGGYYTQAEIGNYLLSVCFDPGYAYNNKTVIRNGLNRAAQAILNFQWLDYGICDQGNENLQVHIKDYGVNDCGFVTPWAETQYLSFGDTQTHMWFNKNCFDIGKFYLGDSPPVPSGKVDLESVAAHEGEHALGLDHYASAYVVSDGGAHGLSGCNYWTGYKLDRIAIDDENGLLARYPYLTKNTSGQPIYALCVD